MIARSAVLRAVRMPDRRRASAAFSIAAPITPVCRVGTPCDAPAPGVTLVFTRAGHAFRTRTGSGGHFSIALRPGLYAVRVVPATRIGSGLSPRTVRVPVGGWARVRLMLDTGIR